MSTPYEVLGVAPDATAAQIKKAYHVLMLVYHSDKNPNASEEQKVEFKTKSQEAINAWEILPDSKRRREYDDSVLHRAKRQRRSYHNPYDVPSYYTSNLYRTPPSDDQSEGCDLESDPEGYSPPRTSTPPPPKKFPRSLEIASHGWAMSVTVGGNYEPYDWGQGSVFCEENRIFIYMKIRKAENGNPLNNPDVNIEIWSTRMSISIHKIESLYKHRMQPEGIDEQLLLTVFLKPNAWVELRKMEQYDKDAALFKFFWNVHANQADSTSFLKPPADVITHSTCLHFFPKKPHQMAMFMPKPDHSDNPRSVLLKDSDLRPATELKFIGINGSEPSWITLKRVMRGETKMYQLGACAWQELGQGRGEREKAAADAYR